MVSFPPSRLAKGKKERKKRKEKKGRTVRQGATNDDGRLGGPRAGDITNGIPAAANHQRRETEAPYVADALGMPCAREVALAKISTTCRMRPVGVREQKKLTGRTMARKIETPKAIPGQGVSPALQDN